MSEYFNGNYYIIKNKYIGRLVKKIWNNTAYLFELENCYDYDDVILKNKNNRKNREYLFRDVPDNIFKNYKGYMIESVENDIKQISRNNNNIIESFRLMNIKKIDHNKITNEIIAKLNTRTIEEPIIIKQTETLPNEIDRNLIASIFNTNDSLYTRTINKKKDVSEVLLVEQSDKIKDKILKDITEQQSFDTGYYYELNNSLMYKYPTNDEYSDILSFGKIIIKTIIDKLNYFETEFVNDEGEIIQDSDGNNLFDSYTLFGFLKFDIVGDYIEISKNNDKVRKITEEIVPDLNSLSNQYNKEIDYSLLCTLLASVNNITTNKQLLMEVMKIVSQEYLIGFQPKINLMIWTIIRIILCWYADKDMNEKIYKIKILINIFRSRKTESYNENNIEPLITIFPQYGKQNAYYILAHMNLYFFRFKEFGEKNNKPTYYKNMDDDSLIYYSNGSSKMKRYIKLLQNKGLEDRLYNEKMTQINENGVSIEYKISSIEKENNNRQENIDNDNIIV